MRNWLNRSVKRVIVNGFVSKQKLLMSVFPQESILRPTLLKIFINDIDSGIDSTLRKFAGDTKLSCTANMFEGRDAMQRNLDRLEK